jgi:hypothetical protein
MERSAFAFIQAIDSAENFRKQTLRFGAAGEQVAMVSVRGEEIIIAAQTCERRHAGRLLADIKMVVATERAVIV